VATRHLAAEGELHQKAQRQLGAQNWVAIELPDRMGLQPQIEVEITTAAGAGLEVALGLEPQGGCRFSPPQVPAPAPAPHSPPEHAHSVEGLGEAEVLIRGFGIQVWPRMCVPRAQPKPEGIPLRGKAAEKPKPAGAPEKAGTARLTTKRPSRSLMKSRVP